MFFLRLFFVNVCLVGLFLIAPAQAQVEHAVSDINNTAISVPKTPEDAGKLTFYSHSWGENFPHAFVIIEEMNEFRQRRMDAFGFTAKSLTPGILLGSVKGHVLSPNARYIRQSDPHFTLAFSPEQGKATQAVRQKWSSGPGSCYNVNTHNYVHFVAEIAQAVSLVVNEKSESFKKPASFLNEVMAMNPSVQPYDPVSESKSWQRSMAVDYVSS